MSEVKYTPGPWWKTETGVRDRGGYICHTAPAYHYPGQDERFKKEAVERAANKTLIAAAPELLEALKKLTLSLHLYQNMTNTKFAWDEIDIARAAIAKAAGGVQ